MADQSIGSPGEIISKADAARLTTGRLIEPELEDEHHSDDLSDLVSRLRFSLNNGRIWLDTQRVALIHLSTLASLRAEMIDKLGLDEARGFFTRMGYASGSRDATIARKLRPHHETRDAYAVGPQLRKLQGVTALEPVRFEIDVRNGHFYSEATFPESFEADTHIATYGLTHEAVCWMQSGYSSGYAST